MFIYKVTNLINDKVYIGQTTKSIEKRWSEHNSTRNDCKLLHAAIKKYGKENFSIEPIRECFSIEELNKLERFYIKELKSLAPFGYNLSLGGNQKGKHSPETKQKLRMLQLGKSKPKQSKESIEKRKKSNVWKNHTKECKTYLSSICKHKKSIVDQNGTIYSSIKEAARRLNLYRENIRKVLQGKLNHTGNYKFKYIEGN